MEKLLNPKTGPRHPNLPSGEELDTDRKNCSFDIVKTAVSRSAKAPEESARTGIGCWLDWLFYSNF